MRRGGRSLILLVLLLELVLDSSAPPSPSSSAPHSGREGPRLCRRSYGYRIGSRMGAAESGDSSHSTAIQNQRWRTENAGSRFFAPHFLSLVDRAAAGVADHAFAGAATGDGLKAELRTANQNPETSVCSGSLEGLPKERGKDRQQNGGSRMRRFKPFHCPHSTAIQNQRWRTENAGSRFFAPHFFVSCGSCCCRSGGPRLCRRGYGGRPKGRTTNQKPLCAQGLLKDFPKNGERIGSRMGAAE